MCGDSGVASDSGGVWPRAAIAVGGCWRFRVQLVVRGNAGGCRTATTRGIAMAFTRPLLRVASFWQLLGASLLHLLLPAPPLPPLSCWLAVAGAQRLPCCTTSRCSVDVINKFAMRQTPQTVPQMIRFLSCFGRCLLDCVTRLSLRALA